MKRSLFRHENSARLLGLILGTVIAIAAITASRLTADTITWDGQGTNDNFNSFINWDPNQVPGLGDTAVFDGDANVIFTRTESSDVLQVNGGTVFFDSSDNRGHIYNVTGGVAPLINIRDATLIVGTQRRVAVNTGHLVIGVSSGNASVSVIGNSSLNATGGLAHHIGGDGFAGSLQYSNDARGMIGGTLSIANGGASDGALSAVFGSQVTINHLNLATAGAVSNASTFARGLGASITQNENASLTAGSNASGVVLIGADDRAVFSTGTGDITINRNAQIFVGSALLPGAAGGAFNANGNVILNGGAIRVGAEADASFNLAAGRTLTASNDAQIEFQAGSARLSDGTTWNIQSGADLTAGSLAVGHTPGLTTTVVIDGIGSTLSADATGLPSFLGIGGNADVTFRNGAVAHIHPLLLSHLSSTAGTSAVRVENGANLFAGDLIMATGAGGGTATLTVDGADSRVFEIGESDLNIGHASAGAATINITNGAHMSRSGLTQVHATGTINIDATGRLALRGDVVVDGGVIQSAGGDISVGPMGFGGTDWTLRNNGLVDLSMNDDFFVAFDSNFNVESGAEFRVGDLNISIGGTLTLDGSGTTTTQSGDSTLTVGVIEFDPGTLNISNNAVYTTGTGQITLEPTGIINLDGGTLNVNGLVKNNGGTFNFTAGALNVAGDFAVGDFGLLPQRQTLTSDHAVNVTGTTTIEPFRTLILDGGSLSTGDLVVDGTLDFRRGTLSIIGLGGLAVGPAGPLGSAVTLGAGQTINVAHTAIVQSGASLLLQTGGTFNARALINNGHIVLDGVNSTLAGGRVTNVGVLRGNGQITAAVNNTASGEIRAENGKTLLFTPPADPNQGLVNLQGGTLQFSGPLTNAAGGRIAGRGALITGGPGLTNEGDIALSSGITDVFGDVTNAAGGRITVSGNADVTFWNDVTSAGALFKVSAGSSATFFGTLAGAGISGPGDVYVEADVTPGFSPGVASFGGDLTLAETANLLIELAGVTPGAQHDQLSVAGELSLAGNLTVQMIGGFTPSLGNEFVIAAYASHTGQFDTLAFPPLPPGLNWSLDYEQHQLVLSTTSTILPGDIDQDGDVDRTDAALFTPHLGAAAGSLWATGDFDGDDATTLADLGLLQANFGQSLATSAAAAAPIPEPTTALAALLLLALTFRFRKSINL